jgi:hypothetical protein
LESTDNTKLQPVKAMPSNLQPYVKTTTTTTTTDGEKNTEKKNEKRKEKAEAC